MSWKALVVDDDKFMQEVVRASLESAGAFKVETAGSAKEALELLGKEAFDAVILDLVLPDAKGADVCGKIKRDPRTARIPVIILTGIASEEKLKEAKAAGASACITKPFDPLVLASEVSRLASHN